MEAFIIKRGDTLPALEAILSDDNGPVSLDGASVFFVLREARDAEDCGGRGAANLVLKKPAVVVGDQGIGSATRGKVRYEWSANDTAQPGRYRGEFEVHFGTSGIWSFPSVGSIPVVVNEDMG